MLMHARIVPHPHARKLTTIDNYFIYTGKFLSRQARDAKLKDSGIQVIKLVKEAVCSRDEMKKLLNNTNSVYYDGPVEVLISTRHATHAY